MSRQTFPTFFDQPGCLMHNFAIDGAAVGATAGSGGLDGRGKFLCNISKASNVVTIDWQVSFGDIPYVFFQTGVGQNNTLVEIISSTVSQLVFQTVQAADGTTPVTDADLYVHVDGYNTTSYVS
jgi:hypothetical protein